MGQNIFASRRSKSEQSSSQIARCLWAEHLKPKKVNVWCQQFKDGRTDLKGDQEKKTDRPRTSHTSDNCSKFERLIKEVLEHPPYSPDLAPLDFHLFGPLKKSFGRKTLCGSGGFATHSSGILQAT
ncbi:hypothetical protein AVEN_31469-1 [Araneus ventricosus]|uniref:Mos1 transposase HTH domain-containing protein n=1 Tax=Araneus ventricosus TaxID=182803 RepID=A0A4Y2W2Q4_ARAVE|nr:hypothetical protein AVEN_31469-1 [Araneus ventricosus]